MEEVIQLNLTEKESVILQAIIAVGITLRTENVTEKVLEDLDRRMYSMKFFMDAWPESSEFLANKMTNLVKISTETIGMELK